MNLVESNIPAIHAFCKSHKVKSLFVFGSVLNSKFSERSDIDLLVDFLPQDLYNYADNYFDLKEKLESLFNRSVDLLESKAIRNPYLKEQIDREKKLVYES
jgi:predicted nucleotidyltransferase